MQENPQWRNAMRTPRPSLNALRAFEATARLRSFSAAADELSVTHGAISRHVRALEESLGMPLLKRDTRSTEATMEGARLADSLTSAFNLIQASIEQFRPGPLTLSCSESIMMYWLIPRIAQFHEQHPAVELRFNMSHGPIEFMRDNIALALRLSTIEPPRDALVSDVVAEWIGPVCSAEYMQTHRLTSLRDLGRVRLLTSKTRPASWAQWRTAMDLNGIDSTTEDLFDHFYLLIQAAKCGLGVANVPRMLVRDDLSNGTLVAPFGFVPGPHKLVLWTAPHMASRSEMVALEDWIKGELRRSEKDG